MLCVYYHVGQKARFARLLPNVAVAAPQLDEGLRCATPFVQLRFCAIPKNKIFAIALFSFLKRRKAAATLVAIT
jgi:hypothetical protein